MDETGYDWMSAQSCCRNPGLWTEGQQQGGQWLLFLEEWVKLVACCGSIIALLLLRTVDATCRGGGRHGRRKAEY